MTIYAIKIHSVSRVKSLIHGARFMAGCSGVIACVVDPVLGLITVTTIVVDGNVALCVCDLHSALVL